MLGLSTKSLPLSRARVARARTKVTERRWKPRDSRSLILVGRAARRASACSWIMWGSRNGLLPPGSNACSFELITNVGTETDEDSNIRIATCACTGVNLQWTLPETLARARCFGEFGFQRIRVSVGDSSNSLHSSYRDRFSSLRKSATTQLC